jgi:ribosomal protein S18 acetylase RimI-like enzyme
MIIRLYQASDHPAVRALIAELQGYERSLDPYTVEPDEPVVDSYFAQMMDWVAQKEGALFVAEIEHRVVGFVTIIIETNDELLTTFRRYGYITDIVVSAGYRGQGIARMLLLEAEAYTRGKNVTELMLNVLAENPLALTVYERFGFRNREILMHKRLI